jgi:AsmA protein
VTVALGLKRLGLVVLAAVVVGIGMLALSPLFISADTARETVQNEIRAVTGLDLVLRGPASVSLFPSGAVNFADVVLGEGSGEEPALAAERLTAHLRLWPLLIGRIEIADIALVKPRIAITLADNGASNWSMLLNALAHAAKPEPGTPARTVSFSEIRIDNGTIVARDLAHGVTEILSDAELSLAWPSISNTFAATGHFVWRDNPVEGSISVGSFVAALTGDRTSLKFRVSGQPLKLAFDGFMSNQPTLKIEGTVSADAPSLRNALLWTGQRPLPGGGLGHFALKAKTDLVGGTIALSSVNVELDGNTAEGVLTYAADGRRTLQGTLAAENLDVTPYISTVRLMAANAHDWDRMPIKLDGFTNFDLDLRLSAARVTIANAKLGRTGIAANLRSGQLNITVGESQAFGGNITGSFGIANSEAGAEVKAQMQFADVDLESCLNELLGIRNLEGKGNLYVALESSGDSVMGLTHALNGNATLTATHGALTGFNVEQLLRRLDSRPLSGTGSLRSGSTPFDTLTAGIKIVKGTATMEDVRIDGPAVRVGLGGSASIPSREVDLQGTASLIPAASDAKTGFDLPFVVRGPWDDFIIVPDPQSLIRRSGAAAPLLDAIRGRLTGGAAPAATGQSGGAGN